eukprot:scaffold1346_cov260-Pinguiococcus_pyrenoidosus.AAC.2
MDRKALHDSAYQLYSEEFIAKEARGERSNGLSEEALTAELSAESLQRLMRANDCNPVVETAGGELVGSVKGSTIWSMFESGKSYIVNNLAPLFKELTTPYEKGIPSGQDIHQVLLELRVKVLTVSLSNWAAQCLSLCMIRGRKKLSRHHQWGASQQTLRSSPDDSHHRRSSRLLRKASRPIGTRSL